jgi:hypothetical protein
VFYKRASRRSEFLNASELSPPVALQLVHSCNIVFTIPVVKKS